MHGAPSPTEMAHQPVLLEEATSALVWRPDGHYVDATFGRGGHTRAILRRLSPEARLLAIDRDPEAIEAARALTDSRLIIAHAAFSSLGALVRRIGWERISGVLFDLGVSSPQLEDPRRGFSFRGEGPLDMRMDTTRGETAAQWLEVATEREIEEVIRNHGEERFARQIAKAIAAARVRRPIRTTRELAELVGRAVRTREPGQDPATRTFQAVRIHLNQELEELPLALAQATDLLEPGGRIVIISFHSLEDRIAKNFIRDAARPEARLPRFPLRADQLPQPKLRALGKPVRPGAAEVATNPRARSAMMRVAEKLAAG